MPSELQEWIDYAHELKRLMVELGIFGGDMPPIVDGLRDGATLIRTIAPEVDRDQGLEAARLAIVGLQADEVRLALDVHMTNSPVNPTTGDAWGPGEMQEACEAGACQIGLITDALFLLRMLHDGTITFLHHPYHVHKEAKEIVWVGDLTDLDGTGLDGLVVDRLREFFNTTLLVDAAVEAGFGSADKEDLQKSTTPILLQLFAELGYHVLVPNDSPLL